MIGSLAGRLDDVLFSGDLGGSLGGNVLVGDARYAWGNLHSVQATLVTQVPADPLAYNYDTMTTSQFDSEACPTTIVQHKVTLPPPCHGSCTYIVQKRLNKLTGIIGGLRPIHDAQGAHISVLGDNSDPSSVYYLYFAAVIGCKGTALPMVALTRSSLVRIRVASHDVVGWCAHLIKEGATSPSWLCAAGDVHQGVFGRSVDVFQVRKGTPSPTSKGDRPALDGAISLPACPGCNTFYNITASVALCPGNGCITAPRKNNSGYAEAYAFGLSNPRMVIGAIGLKTATHTNGTPISLSNYINCLLGADGNCASTPAAPVLNPEILNDGESVRHSNGITYDTYFQPKLASTGMTDAFGLINLSFGSSFYSSIQPLIATGLCASMEHNSTHDTGSTRPAAPPNEALLISQMVNTRSVAEVLATGAERFPGQLVIQADWNQPRNWCPTTGIYVHPEVRGGPQQMRRPVASMLSL